MLSECLRSYELHSSGPNGSEVSKNDQRRPYVVRSLSTRMPYFAQLVIHFL